MDQTVIVKEQNLSIYECREKAGNKVTDHAQKRKEHRVLGDKVSIHFLDLPFTKCGLLLRDLIIWTYILFLPFLLTITFKVILSLQKSCKNRTKNSYLSSFKFPRSEYLISFNLLYMYIYKSLRVADMMIFYLYLLQCMFPIIVFSNITTVPKSEINIDIVLLSNIQALFRLW